MYGTWKVSYVDFNGKLAECSFAGQFNSLAYFNPPNGANTSIYKVELVPEQN